MNSCSNLTSLAHGPRTLCGILLAGWTATTCPAADLSILHVGKFWHGPVLGATTREPHAYKLSVADERAGLQILQQRPAGTVVAWGDNSRGQTKVPRGLVDVVAISAGLFQSVALLTNGTITAWGTNPLGHVDVSEKWTAVAIAAGALHSVALWEDGTPATWGVSLPDESTRPENLENVIAVAAGGHFDQGDFHDTQTSVGSYSLALRRDGTLISWGWSFAGLAKPPANLSNVVAIAAGAYHSLALRSDGTVVGWGDNSSGQTNVPVTLTNAIAIAAGGRHSLALRNDGTILGWGDNSSGQINLPAALTNVTAIAAGGRHNLALRGDRTVVGWGDNRFRQAIPPSGLRDVIAIAAGANHSLVLRRPLAGAKRLR